MITGAAQRDASGNSGRHRVSIPKVPTLSSTPTSSTDVPTGAASAVSGSQVCTGHIGALIAKAMKNARKTSRSVLTDMSRCPTRLSTRKPCGPCGPCTYSVMTPASMIRPPASEKSRNFTAAYRRWSPPNEPIMK